MRYQLLKTSPYLGGQIRWDIPLYYHYDNGIYKCDTPELHIVPLDDNITFNEGNSWKTLNYTHLENIKHLFEQIGDVFFSAEGEWTGSHWLYNNGDVVDPYSHIYNMGARRVRFERYGKQFSYLCPLWISEETDPHLFGFEFSIKISGEERDHVVRRVMGLSDDICDYMSEYFNKSARYNEPDPSAPDPGYQGVNDDLLSIKFDPDYAFITGVQADKGRYTTNDISYMIHDLLHREIPMIEFDNMLVSKFRESNIIAQQLINLNFLFNMEDISYILKESLLGKHITVALRVMYDGQYLPVKDFYTNYSNIPVYRVDQSTMSYSKNVCEYMGDNTIVDYMYTNKFTQPIFHWAMVENPTYIYNFYDGFAPVFKDGDEYYRIEGRYYDQADVSQELHNVYNSAASWCKLKDVTNLTSVVTLNYNEIVKNNPEHYTSRLFVNNNTGIVYLNNNRYDMTKMDQSLYGISDLPPIYIYTLIKNAGEISCSDVGTDPQLNASVIINWNNDRIIMRFECDDISYSTYRLYSMLMKSVVENGGNIYTDDNGRKFGIFMADGNPPMNGYVYVLINFIINLYNTWIPPYRIDFTRGTITDIVEPLVGEQTIYYPHECNMYKYNAHKGFVLRYTGGLCPFFMDPTDENYKNISYRYKQWGDITTPEVQKYNSFLKTGMLPEYPSIGFYSFEDEQDTQNRPDWYKNWPWDVTWKNDGCVYVIPEQYSVVTSPKPAIPYNEKNEEIEMWELLYNHITSLGIPVNSTWMKHKIKELYKISYNFDYASETDVDNVVYHVKFNLR